MLWFCFEHISLKDNLRVNDNDLKFKEQLVNIGDGKCLSEFEKENEAIEIPEEFLINQDIITEIFNDKLNVSDEEIRKKIILAPKNVDIHSINNEILLKIEGDVKEYLVLIHQQMIMIKIQKKLQQWNF